jgi:hypothetical protein
MNYKIEVKKATEILENLSDLEKLLDEIIVDLHNVKGMMPVRHAYVLYRNMLLDARVKLRDSLIKDINGTKVDK